MLCWQCNKSILKFRHWGDPNILLPLKEEVYPIPFLLLYTLWWPELVWASQKLNKWLTSIKMPSFGGVRVTTDFLQISWTFFARASICEFYTTPLTFQTYISESNHIFTLAFEQSCFLSFLIQGKLTTDKEKAAQFNDLTKKQGSLYGLKRNEMRNEIVTSQELRMLSRSLSGCKSLLLNVMIQVWQFVSNSPLRHQFT